MNLTGNEEATDDAFSFNKLDYKSDPADSEPEHDSDGEENLVSRSHSSNTTQIRAYDNAGHSLRDVPSNQRYESGLLAEPWCPLLTLDDFNPAN